VSILERGLAPSFYLPNMPYTLAQLEAFVSSPAYDAATAGLIARGVPALKAAGAPGELISPGVRRIHGNLCNVHGRYGPCDKALSGKKKPRGRKPRKAAKPKVDRAAEHAKNRSATLTSQGYSADEQASLTALRNGAQPGKVSQGLIDKGLVEQANDGSYRMTASGRALVTAADQGDAGRARDTASGAADRLSGRRARQAAASKRQQDAAGKRAASRIGRELAQRERDAAHAKRVAAQAKKKPSGRGSKKPDAGKEKPVTAAPTRRRSRGLGLGATGAPKVGSGAKPAKAPAKPKPAKAPAKQLAPALTTAAQSLSDGKKLTDADQLSLIRNGLARLVKGELVLTAAGQRATMKAFHIFKDASGRDRWVAQSSTAFQDRDKEIVSTKALADDCAFADATGSYGPLRWWHMPGLDLGDCDFNAMHGRVLIESGTFRTPAIAQKVAAAADGLEISLGFLHLPSEPDADGVFHHIRRFERSLVPRGKASNRFTAFTVKETRMFDPTKVAALKTLGFSDDDITNLQAQAAATEKTATDQGVAFKADEPPAEPPDVVINGVTYKAFPPVDNQAPIDSAAEDAMDGGADDAMEAPAEGGLTLSPEDLSAITDAVNAALQGAVSQIMGGLDLEKKVAGHVAGLMAPYQATKDAEQAQTREQVAALAQQNAALATQLAELSGDQPAAPYRPSAASNNVLTDATMLAAAKQALDPNGTDPWADIKRGLGLAQQQ
jgi:hypothetical protein